MKTFELLAIPKTTAWERKSLIRLPYKIRNIVTGVSNIFRWLPIIFRDRQWDHSYMLTILEHKLLLMRETLVRDNRHMGVDRINRDMTNALNLLVRVRDDHYAVEYLEYVDTAISFEQIDGTGDYMVVQKEIEEHHIAAYLQRYPATVRQILKKYPELSEDTKGALAFYVASYNQQKANRLLWKIIGERHSQWWD